MDRTSFLLWLDEPERKAAKWIIRRAGGWRCWQGVADELADGRSMSTLSAVPNLRRAALDAMLRTVELYTGDGWYALRWMFGLDEVTIGDIIRGYSRREAWFVQEAVDNAAEIIAHRYRLWRSQAGADHAGGQANCDSESADQDDQ